MFRLVCFLWVFLVVSHLSNLSVPLLRSCQDKKLLMEKVSEMTH